MSAPYTMLGADDVRALGGDPAAALVLARISWRSERDGAWVASIETIAAETGMNPRRVRRAIDRLRDAGKLASERASGSDATLRWTPTDLVADSVEPADRFGHDVTAVSVSTSYKTDDYLETNTPAADAATSESAVVVDLFSRNGADDMSTHAFAADEPMFAADVPEPRLPVFAAVTDPVDEAFAAFWRVWPRRVARADALKSFRRAVKSGADPQLIIAAAGQQQHALISRGLRFCPHATTWLNQQRWEDDIESIAPAAQSRNGFYAMPVDSSYGPVVAGIVVNDSSPFGVLP